VKRIIFFIILVSLILGTSFIFLMRKLNKNEEKVKKEELPPLEVVGMVVDRGEIIVYTEGVGRVKPNKQAVFLSPINSYVERINIYEGKRVKKGEFLLKLQNEEVKAEYEKAFYNLKKTKASYEFSLKSENGDTNTLKVTSGFLEAKREYERIKKILEETEIYAPFDGVVGNVSISTGDKVNIGMELFELFDVSNASIVVELPNIEMEDIKIGRKAIIYQFTSGKEYIGTVIGVSPVIDEKENTGKVVISANSSLIPGSIVKVKIVSGEYKGRIRVPNEAILRRENRDLVFLVKNGYAVWQWIKKGVEGEKYTEVLEGVNEGDTVIVEGQFTIAHNTPVSVILK